LGVELIGGEIAHTRFRLRRRVHAEDPVDLGAPLAYQVEVLGADDEDLEPAAAALSKSRQWVLTALRAGGDLQTVKQPGGPGWRLGVQKATAGPLLVTPHPDASVGDGEAGAGEAPGRPYRSRRAHTRRPALQRLGTASSDAEQLAGAHRG
jgi:hypothetical protein